jgi:hypothetical protein
MGRGQVKLLVQKIRESRTVAIPEVDNSGQSGIRLGPIAGQSGAQTPGMPLTYLGTADPYVAAVLTQLQGVQTVQQQAGGSPQYTGVWGLLQRRWELSRRPRRRRHTQSDQKAWPDLGRHQWIIPGRIRKSISPTQPVSHLSSWISVILWLLKVR